MKESLKPCRTRRGPVSVSATAVSIQTWLSQPWTRFASLRSASGGAGESGATPGTGLVDFASLFTVLHEAAFTGPVEILTEYVYDGVNLNSTFWADSPALTLTRQQLFTTIAASLATYQGYATAAGWTIAQQDTADPA